MRSQQQLMVTDVDKLVDACGQQSVCVYGGATISNANELAAALPEGVRVVVIPQPDQAESVQSSSLAAGLRNATDADTVIVIEDYIGKDRFAVSSSSDAKSITEALYSQNEADGGVAVESIAQTLAASTPTPAQQPGADPTGFSLITVLAVLGVATLVTMGITLGTRRRRRSNRAIAGNRRLEKELTASLNGPDGEIVGDAIEALRERATAYPELGPQLSGLAGHLSELFVRVHKRGNDQQVRLLQSQYKDTLGKLHTALSDDYYGDIQRHPQYWSGPQQRLAEVHQAVEAVDRQAVENIKQVNESRDLDFKVALDSLIKNVSDAKLSDVYSDREQ